MKFRVWDRLILFLGAVITVAAGIGLFVAGLRTQGAEVENASVFTQVMRIVFGVLLIVFGGYLIVLPRRYAITRRDFVVQRTDTGELRIAVKAIENLVKKCVNLHEEIQLISISVLNARDGVVVELNISLANNISIPLAVASLQKQIKQYLVASSGIEVKEVRVSVESTKDEPMIVAEAAEQEAEEDDKKAPLHQRLFGQAEQPAIVPEPPKMEPLPENENKIELTYVGADAPAPLDAAKETEEEKHG